MSNLYRVIIRTSAFFRKEIAEVLRQPRLILTLALGPFLILLVFGIGYNNSPRAVRTLFVAQPDSPMAKEIQSQIPNISPQLIFMGIDPNKQDALNKLRNGDIELVMVAPDNVYQTVRNNQQAVFELYHNEIDPAQASYVEYLGQVVIEEVNRRVLMGVVAQGQTETSSLNQEINQARANNQAARQALQAGNVSAAQQSQQKLNQNVANIASAAGASALLLSGVPESGGTGSNDAQDITGLVNALQQDNNQNTQIQSNQSNYNADIFRLEKTDNDLASLQEKLNAFQGISPAVMIRPFTVENNSVATITPTPVDFFSPAVIVLLLQHVAITISALSIVRESSAGTMELFRVSPVTSAETIIGKYISYMVFGIILGAILAVLMVFILKIPLLGTWQDFALICIALLFASLGYGFIISLLAETESQAVQLAMIALLVSVFFSGFILDLRYFFTPVRVLSFIIPATYGNILLKDIMLRGAAISPIYIGGLVLMGVVLFIIAWLLMRRRMSRR